MEGVPATAIVRWMRAAGEPSRLRLLALCAEGRLSVSDLAAVLGQSEPRVSRHLRILCEAGLLERLPQGQRVHHQVAASGAAPGFVRGLLAQLDPGDPQLQQDRGAARACAAATAGGSTQQPACPAQVTDMPREALATT
jgi:DNA-binding transcriptional ArsR family regulator